MNVTKIGFFSPRTTPAINRANTGYVQKTDRSANFAPENLTFGLKYEADIYEYKRQSTMQIRRREFTDLLSAPPEEGQELSKFDRAIVENADRIASCGKKGLPVEYSREDFTERLYRIAPLSTLRKVDCGFRNFVGGGLFKIPTGYDGILYPRNLDTRNSTQREMSQIIRKFVYHNEVRTGIKEFDEALNTIIKGSPEFANCIGKKQHEGHDYSLDVHSLMVLANVIKDPRYKDLSEDDKFVLKMMAIFHDIAKPEGKRDPQHPFISEGICTTFMDKYNLEPEMRERILHNIGDHHWLQWYNMSQGSKIIIEDQLDRYSSPTDYTLGLIFAKADLAATSKEVYDAFSPLLERGPQKAMREAAEARFGVKY